MRPCLAALILSVWLAPTVSAGDLRNFEDAALHAVQFVDDNEGWTVGDDGVVWHTMDGGGTWERQPTGVRASLRSVHFLNPYTGWIAGREELPHGTASAGVLLYTNDGGLKWQLVNTNTLPGLNRIQFVNQQTGFAVGDSTEQFPTGIFRTTDAGRSWQPIAGPRSPAWLAADFQNSETGALVGAWSRLAILRQGALAKADAEDTMGGRAIRSLQVVGNRAVAVGQGGVVLLSRDSAGNAWGYADHKLPTEVRAAWDFHAVSCAGDQIWAAGRPGSVVLHSPDQGKSWDTLFTGQPLPLNGLFFVSGQRGWGVGEFGTILGTADGGKTWKVQHQGGRRAAILFIHARPAGLPVDTVAQLGGDDGYLAVGVRALASDPASTALERSSEAQRFAAAVRLAGGAAGEMLWQFPVAQHLAHASKNDLIQSWNTLHADRAPEEMLRQLVLALRIWRPSVIVTDHPDARVTGWPGEGLITEALHEAFTRAADAQAFPEQLKQLGLQPWSVAKVYGRWEERTGAQVALDSTRMSGRLEGTIRDFATPAAGLLFDNPTPLPMQRYYHLLDSRAPGANCHTDLMGGVEMSPGDVARRRQSEAPEIGKDFEKIIRARRNLQALAEMRAGELTDPNRVLTQVGPRLAEMPDSQAAATAFAIASQYARVGQWSLAQELFALMVNRYPAQPLSAEAYRWLIRYNSSSEALRRQEMGQFLAFSQSTIRQASLKAPVEVIHSGQAGLLSNPSEMRNSYQRCLEYGKGLDAFGPLLSSDPSIQFCLQAAHRRLGEFDKAQKYYMQFALDHPDSPWHKAAATELWLVNRNGRPAKPLAYCRQTATRPLLDGQFDDECWQDWKPVALSNAVGDTLKEYPTEFRLAYDRDFVYLALRCRHPAGHHVPPVKVRPPDADLRPYDRVSLLFDLDRDYSTYFQLQVDQRGCVCDDCWGDRSWNPRWFVAVHSEKDYWQIEAAIPVNELTGEAVMAGKAWACNVVRVIPGRGVQAWSLPADVQPRPEGMGLLMFLDEAGAARRETTEKPGTKP
jgi:photosystem II stability/assembly factor-like uncharacterized protein/tetratricopeptide (TPR) repeat protein